MEPKPAKQKGRPRRKDYPERITINFTTEQRDNITRVSERFNVSESQLIRECVESELPRLVQRLKKGTQRKKARDRAGFGDL